MTYLKTDDQTMNDLAIFDETGKDSIFDIYNKTQTAGGSKQLKELFQKPLADASTINRRSELYDFFSRQDYDFPVETGAVSALAYYIENDDRRTQLQPEEKTIRQKLKDTVATNSNRVFVENGVKAFLDIYVDLDYFLEKVKDVINNSPYEQSYHRFVEILKNENFNTAKKIINNNEEDELTIAKIAELDKCIRFSQREFTLELLNMLYKLDILITIGKIANNKAFNFAEALPAKNNRLSLRQVWHPFLENAVANNLKMDSIMNVVFLTGANMAGKSTLMKAVSIALYLAHLGLPVAADNMEFSVRDGIYTNINLPDDLQIGASHFYAEVLRVKEIASLLQSGMKLFVVFDELFRGTNVKDAYDGTVELVRAFKNKENSHFIVSTHIMEAGERLLKEDLNIKYLYLPTKMEKGQPVYSRLLQKGITDDRKGMTIIENENILDLLESGIKNDDKTCLS